MINNIENYCCDGDDGIDGGSAVDIDDAFLFNIEGNAGRLIFGGLGKS